MRLPSGCLGMDVCSDSTIPAFRRHVIILNTYVLIDASNFYKYEFHLSNFNDFSAN
jgi:hypothetical protein